ncbi:MAG: DUF4157 domain-containing protein [Acidobacteriaceae bacterium]|nr:DUF4157 domain-containing protein [Acidobacteriaceae bacterium]
MQPKLILSQPGDAAEIEADRMAESVVARRPPAGVVRTFDGLQRQAKVGGPDEQSADQDKMLEEGLEPDETGRPKRKPGVAAPFAVSWKRPASAAEPLPHQTRAFMEARFGHDFSRVRIHSDAAASASVARLQAHAYTVGNDIYFGRGNFQPDNFEGKKLLAHELTHVVQQAGGGISRTIHRKCKKPAKCGPSGCDSDCAPTQGLQHSPPCGNEACPTSGAANKASFIRHLDVNLSTQMVEAEVGDAKHATSIVGPFLSSPNPSETPTGLHTVDIKCSACHTNQCGNGMGWFTSFYNGLLVGFHNSQRVAKGVRSHGCVRVPCDRARWIHDNSESGTTTVCVHKGGKKSGNDWGCKHSRPNIGGSGGSGSAAANGTSGGPEQQGVAADLTPRQDIGVA